MFSHNRARDLLILATTSLLISRAIFFFFDDPEGPNLLVVAGAAAVVFFLSLVPHLFNRSAAYFKRFLLSISIQIAVVLCMYVLLK